MRASVHAAYHITDTACHTHAAGRTGARDGVRPRGYIGPTKALEKQPVKRILLLISLATAGFSSAASAHDASSADVAACIGVRLNATHAVHVAILHNESGWDLDFGMGKGPACS